MKNGELIETAVRASNDYETTNTDLKRKYLIKNIQIFNYIASLVSVNKGTFGTGYPFYVLEKGLTGQLPVIQEQIRYNKELLNHARTTTEQKWTCAECLTKRYHDMPDLKQICKPCPNIDNELKPRKIINRLPDLDMWLVCGDGHLEKAQRQLSRLLERYGIHTSDVDPLQTIRDMDEIIGDIKNGVMPTKYLPIDGHIIEYSKLQKLIARVPETLRFASENNIRPYLPIHPKSYRKTWQYDDEAYNFICDFLGSFTEFNLPTQLIQQVQRTREIVAQDFSAQELYNFLLQSSTEANRRRFSEPALKDRFFRKVQAWNVSPKQSKDEEIDLSKVRNKKTDKNPADR